MIRFLIEVFRHALLGENLRHPSLWKKKPQTGVSVGYGGELTLKTWGFPQVPPTNRLSLLGLVSQRLEGFLQVVLLIYWITETWPCSRTKAHPAVWSSSLCSHRDPPLSLICFSNTGNPQSITLWHAEFPEVATAEWQDALKWKCAKWPRSFLHENVFFFLLYFNA